MKNFRKFGMMTAVVLLSSMVSLSALAAQGSGPRGMMGAYNNSQAKGKGPMANESTTLDAFKAQRLEQMKANLDARVAAGTLTQAQADELLDVMTKRMESSNFGPRGMMGRNNAPGKGKNSPIGNDSADLDAFKAQRTEQMKANLDAKVAAGTLTQVQADALLDLMTQRMESNSPMGNRNRMMGPRGGFGGCMWGN